MLQLAVGDEADDVDDEDVVTEVVWSGSVVTGGDVDLTEGHKVSIPRSFRLGCTYRTKRYW